MDYEEAVAGLSLPSGSRPRIYMDYNDQILAPKSLHYLEQYLETYGEPIRYRTTSDSMDNIADWMIRPANRRANRKTADESHNGWTNYETWYVKAIIDNDYDLYMESKNIVNVEHLFNMVNGHPLNDLSYDEMDRVNWDELLEEFDRTANRKANRKRASERMNYGTVYVVTSDGEVVEGETPGDMEFVSVHVYADDQPEVGYYDFDPIVDELYEGVASSVGGAEPVEVVPGYFIGDMGVSADELAKFGPGEYRLCPVSLSFWVGEGEFGDLEDDDGFNYDVVVRY